MLEIVKQPNGLYAVYSIMLDSFAYYGLDRIEVADLLINERFVSRAHAEKIIDGAGEKPGLWHDMLDRIAREWGRDKSEEIKKTILGGESA